MSSTSPTPESVVQRQLEAFNARDLETLLSNYATDAEMFEHPSKLVARGADELRTRFMARFAEPNLFAKLVHRVVVRNTVVDHEIVSRTFPEGPGTLELVMIYEVNDSRITKAWSIPGEKRFTPEPT